MPSFPFGEFLLRAGGSLLGLLKGSRNPSAPVLNGLMLQMSGMWDVIALSSHSIVWPLGHLSLLPCVLPTKILLLSSGFL